MRSKTEKTNNRVLLGLSGGVDSTAAALFLQEQGYAVTGYFFDVRGGQDAALQRAQKTADQLGIPLVHRTVAEAFEAQVISDFCESYRCARTPNPCIVCNPQIKFKTMQEEADRIGAAWLATGHYARTGRGTAGAAEGAKITEAAKAMEVAERAEDAARLCMARCRRKDQSYMLYRLPQDILQRLLLPLGEVADKEQVRDRVRQSGIFNADAADSQEICFIPDGDYISYLKERGISSCPGDFIDCKTGEVLGKHRGIIHYTVGQRKGLGMTFGKPMFVTKLDHKNNTVTLGDNEALFSTKVQITDAVFFGAKGKEAASMAETLLERPLLGKVRYAAQPSPCALTQITSEKMEIVFQNPQRAMTPGQSVVLYDGEILVGGGFITADSTT